jgi:hypothetical protein
METKIKVIIDSIGRYIIGEVASEDEKELKLKFPVILHVQPNPQTNQLQIQTFPLFFVEFIDKDSRDSNIWAYNKAAITSSDLTLDSKIVQQYNNLANPSQIITPSGDPSIVRLFDEE